jgi:hypothetical protein
MSLQKQLMNSNLNKINMNLRKILDKCNADGGVTYNIYSGEYNPTSGYMVSLFGRGAMISGTSHSEAQLANFIHANIDKLANEDYYVGLWKPSSGQTDADVSILIEDLTAACEFGINNNQQAIYDNARGYTISLPTPQRTGTMTQRKTYATVAARATAERYLKTLK